MTLIEHTVNPIMSGVIKTTFFPSLLIQHKHFVLWKTRCKANARPNGTSKSRVRKIQKHKRFEVIFLLCWQKESTACFLFVNPPEQPHGRCASANKSLMRSGVRGK